MENIDLSLKNREVVWFTYKTEPKEESDWIEAEILDLNWAYKSAAVQLKNYKGVTCCGIKNLKRERLYFKTKASLYTSSKANKE